MKIRILVIGINVLIGCSVLSGLGLIAGQELNNQGDTDIFPNSWNVHQNPTIANAFAWIMITMIPASFIGISFILYSLFSKFAKPIAFGVGFLLFGVYVGIIVMGYPYT